MKAFHPSQFRNSLKKLLRPQGKFQGQQGGCVGLTLPLWDLQQGLKIGHFRVSGCHLKSGDMVATVLRIQ
jgi:hypothetical protein